MLGPGLGCASTRRSFFAGVDAPVGPHLGALEIGARVECSDRESPPSPKHVRTKEQSVRASVTMVQVIEQLVGMRMLASIDAEWVACLASREVAHGLDCPVQYLRASDSQIDSRVQVHQFLMPNCQKVGRFPFKTRSVSPRLGRQVRLRSCFASSARSRVAVASSLVCRDNLRVLLASHQVTPARARVPTAAAIWAQAARSAKLAQSSQSGQYRSALSRYWAEARVCDTRLTHNLGKTG
jgi:hypothetical protein